MATLNHSENPEVSAYKNPEVSAYRNPEVSGYRNPEVSGYQNPEVTENGSLDAKEEIIVVPHDVASFSLGFAIDAGGSVTKLCYRSKKDYTQGVPLDKSFTRGKLRLRFFNLSRSGDELVDFIEKNCDVIVPRDGSERPDWLQTGVQCQHFYNKLDEKFNIRTILMPETENQVNGFVTFYTSSPDRQGFLDQPLKELSPRGVEKAMETVRRWLNIVQEAKTFGDGMLGGQQEEAGGEMKAHATKLMTNSTQSLIDEFSVKDLKFPFGCVMLGSTVFINKVDNETTMTMLDLGSCAAKSLLGLGMALTGAESFEELIEMAQRGDRTKVDILYKDVRNRNRTTVDWYSLAPDEYTCYSLGKLTQKEFAGTYTTDDMAAGLLKFFFLMLSKTIIPQLRLHSLDTVVFTGSPFHSSFVKEVLEEAFLEETLLKPFTGGDIIRMAVASHPGFICCLGVWQKNLEMELNPTFN